MLARARNSTGKAQREAPHAGLQYAHDELWPGERITPAPAKSAGRALLRTGMIVLVVLGGAWALLSDQTAWLRLLVEEASKSSAIGRKATASMEPAPPAPIALPEPIMIEPAPAPAIDRSAAASKPPVSRTAVAAEDKAAASGSRLTTGSLPPGPADAAPSLPPAVADPSDPYQKRAIEAGLHPDLSRVLLARLSPDDYRNARIAIRNALAEASDSAVYVWPRQHRRELARFQVRFVPGAASGCRRYVVSVTKDGWLTTALPMEKCGAQDRRAARD